jgi:hypothetical protein
VLHERAVADGEELEDGARSGRSVAWRRDDADPGRTPSSHRAGPRGFRSRGSSVPISSPAR